MRWLFFHLSSKRGETMRKILLINPNSSEKMTADINNTVTQMQLPDIEITTVKMKRAPEVLESFCDYTKASYEVMEFLQQIKGYDGILLACFGDPGLFALKEIAKVPLIGIAEASFAMAQLLGYKFSVMAASQKARPMMDQLIKSYGLGSRVTSIETLNLPIEEFLYDTEILLGALLNAGKQSICSGAEVLILGCAGMTMLGDEVQCTLGVPVIDPIKAGIVLLDAIIRGKFSISRVGLYS
jgi:allantoin racemase